LYCEAGAGDVEVSMTQGTELVKIGDQVIGTVWFAGTRWHGTYGAGRMLPGTGMSTKRDVVLLIVARWYSEHL
jgi:hypothetical protein